MTLWVLPALLLAASLALAEASAPLQFTARSLATNATNGDGWRVIEQAVAWAPDQTAVVICDMWDKHWCRGATERVAAMAPRVNAFAGAARSRGVLVIHCPSETLKFYEGTPQRRLAQAAPRVSTTIPLQAWRGLDRAREGTLPIDDSDGGCDDSPPCPSRPPYPWTRQIATIDVVEGDAITDSTEAFFLMRQRGIRNVFVLGVHLNMCVLGRPFGIRQLFEQGMNVVLVRDLTDTMYNSRRAPQLSHFAGTDLMIEHVEKHWCPTITSDALAGGQPFRFPGDTRPRVAFLIGEDEYDAARTLPEFARKELVGRHGLACSFAQAHTKTNLAGLDALREADLAVIYLRRRTLPPAQLAQVRAYVDSGRPVIGLRTASHGFQNWLEFDREVLGGNYHGHYGKTEGAVAKTQVQFIEAGRDHPILRDLPGEGWTSASWLYKVTPLAPDTTPLLTGQVPDPKVAPEPVAWIHTAKGRRVFYTSLGHQDDFAMPVFRQLLLNAVCWALER